MRIPWFGKSRGGEEPPKQPSGQPVQALMLRFAEERLRAWLTANMSTDLTSRVRSYVIEDTRVCAEALPYRLYVYDLDDPAGQLNYECLQLRSDAPGDVFEHKETNVEGRKLGMFMYRVHVAAVISMDPEVRNREERSRATGRSLAGNFHSELSELASEKTSEASTKDNQPTSQMLAENVAIYVRTTITSKKYDGYEAQLEQFCRQVGWRNAKVYHDRAGGTVDEKELEDMARALGAALNGGDKGKFDAKAFGRRFAEMSETDAKHDRETLRRLMADIDAGAVGVVVVHDLSQLGKSKMAAFQVLSAMMKRAEVHMPGVGKIHSNTTLPCGSDDDYF